MEKSPRWSGFRLAWEDIKRMWSSNVLRRSVLGLLVLPLLYSFIYLWAFWEPTAFLYRMPLAVVNLDKGLTQGNLHINLGNDLVERLEADDKMNWRVVSAAEADTGLERLSYFLVLVIPEDFTERAYSAGTDNPRPTELIYKINEGANMLAAKIGRSIMEQIEKELQKQLSTRYLQVIFDQVLAGAKGLGEAAAGAVKLAQGTRQAYQGATQLANGLQQEGQGIAKLVSGQSQLQSGSAELASGAAQLNEAIQSGVGKVNQIAEPVTAILAEVDNISKAAGDIGQTIREAVERLRDNRTLIGRVVNAIADARQKIEGVISGSLAKLDADVDRQKSSLDSAASALRALGDKHPELKDDGGYSQALKMLEQAAEDRRRIEQDRAEIRSSLTSIRDNFATLSSILSESQPKLEENITGASDKLAGLNFGDIVNRIKAAREKLAGLPEKLNQLAAGTEKLAEGSRKLSEGLATFGSGLSQLQEGNAKLNVGAQQLTQGLAQIDKGQNELAQKLGEAAGMAAQDAKTDQRVKVIADPVEAKETNLHPVPSNGTGFAPYFISLSLWVGSLVLFFVVDLKRVSAVPKRPISYMINKYLALASVSIPQAVILISMLIIGLGLTTASFPGVIYGFAIIVGLAYSAIMFMLVYILGEDVGRFVAILILMLQLTSSSGSYPVELTPPFFSVIQSFLPMTYAVHGLRNIISIGDTAAILRDAAIVAGYGVAALSVLYLLKYRRFLDETSQIGE